MSTKSGQLHSTLLNLGRHFEVAQCDWPTLCRRIDDLLAGQWPLPPECPPALESHAQRITARLLASERIGPAPSPASQGHDFQRIDVDALELIRPRSVGVEHVGLWAMDRLSLPTVLDASFILAGSPPTGSWASSPAWTGSRSPA